MKKIVVIKVVPIQVYKEGVNKFFQINETIFCIIYNMGTLRISTFEAIKKTSSQKTKHLSWGIVSFYFIAIFEVVTADFVASTFFVFSFT